MATDLWSYLQELPGLQRLWKLDETSGTVAADSSGNGRDGTYNNTPDLGKTHIIPNKLDTCIGLKTASGESVSQADAAWMDMNDFTELIFVKPQAYVGGSNETSIIERLNHHFLTYNKLTNKYAFKIQFNTLATLTQAGTTLLDAIVMVTTTYDRANMRLYINNVQDNFVAETRTPAASASADTLGGGGAAFGFPTCDLQGRATYNRALTLAEIEGAYLWATNNAPTQPGAFTSPTPGQVVNNSILLEWGASTDPEGDNFGYEGQVANDGVTFTAHDFSIPVSANPAESYLLDTSSWVYTEGAVVRVRAVDIFGFASAWRESPVFTIDTRPALPGAFTSPTLDQVVNNSVLLEWGTSSDAGGEFGYEGQVSDDNGVTWDAAEFDIPISANPAESYLLDTSTWPLTTLAKARVRAVVASGQFSEWRESPLFTVDTRPAIPGPFTVPTPGQIAHNSIQLVWGTSSDEGGNFGYEGEVSDDNGVTWDKHDFAIPVSANPVETYLLDTSSWLLTSQALARVRAIDAAGAVSDWRVSEVFSVLHPSTAPPDAPVLTLLWKSDHSVRARSTPYLDVDPNFHVATQWQVAPVGSAYGTGYDSGNDTEQLLEVHITGLPQHTLLKMRARFVEDGGGVSSWSSDLVFMTRRLLDWTWFARDLMGTRNGVYGSLAGDNILLFSNSGVPELGYPMEGFIGFRANGQGSSLWSQNLDSTRHIIRLPTDPEIGTPGTWSLMLLVAPDDLTLPRELVGNPGAWFLWYDTDGSVRLIGTEITVGCADPFGGLRQFGIHDGPLVAGEVNLITLVKGEQNVEVIYGGDCSVTIVTDIPPVVRLGINGVVEAGSIGACSGGGGGPCPPLFNGYTDFGWSAQQFIDIGHGTTRAGVGAYDPPYGNGRCVKGIIPGFAWWDEYKLTDGEHDDLNEIRLSGTQADLYDYLLNMPTPPLVYLPCDEPQRPHAPTISVRKRVRG